MEKRKRPALPLDASPQEKYDNLILTIYEEWLKKPGRKFSSAHKNAPNDLNYLGFLEKEEYHYYLKYLVSKGHMDNWGKGIGPYGLTALLLISFDGLKYCRELSESGKNSTRCFVAMAFKDDMEPFYNDGIVKAIEENDFRAIRVDKEHTENEQTINDFIIASIKQSKFCIADLTHQRNGVYFEAGYALGRGLKVIYTCRQDDHENVHFDLKTMQTILYDTPEELRDALSLKIQAFILD